MPKGVRFGGDDAAALAPNWRTLLAVDAGIALASFAIGLGLVLSGQGWAYLLLAAGGLYGFFVGGRVAKWRRIRRAAGLA